MYLYFSLYGVLQNFHLSGVFLQFCSEMRGFQMLRPLMIFCLLGLQYIRDLCVLDYSVVEMEVTAK